MSWRRHINAILLLLAVLFLIIGLADPHIPLKQTKEGVSVVLAIDVSASMLAEDYAPSRLEAAKRSALTLISSLDPKDSAGAVKFGNGATTVSYLTPFKDRVRSKVASIPLTGCEGTSIGDGLATAVDMASSIPNRKKIVILLSDGEQTSGTFSPEEAVTFAKDNHVQVYTIGMGAEQPVTFTCFDGWGFPQRGRTALKEDTLKEIADQTQGTYFRSVDVGTLDEIYRTISDEIKREKEPSSIGIWFFWLALATLLSDLYLRYGRYKLIRGD